MFSRTIRLSLSLFTISYGLRPPIFYAVETVLFPFIPLNKKEREREKYNVHKHVVPVRKILALSFAEHYNYPAERIALSLKYEKLKKREKRVRNCIEFRFRYRAVGRE